jgi:hypothetical protein
MVFYNLSLIQPEATVVIPYVPNLSEETIKMGHMSNIRVVCCTNDTLSARLVKFKPKTDKINKEIVYSSPCMCSKSYIGETGRTLEIRLNEHKNSIRKGEITSKLVEHALNEDHIFEWDKASVLARESKWKARKVHEAALIYMGGDQVVSAPSMDIDPIWRQVMDDYNKIFKPLAVNISNINLRCSAHLKAKEGTKEVAPTQQRCQTLRSYTHRSPPAPMKT